MHAEVKDTSRANGRATCTEVWAGASQRARSRTETLSRAASCKLNQRVRKHGQHRVAKHLDQLGIHRAVLVGNVEHHQRCGAHLEALAQPVGVRVFHYGDQLGPLHVGRGELAPRRLGKPARANGQAWVLAKHALGRRAAPLVAAADEENTKALDASERSSSGRIVCGWHAGHGRDLPRRRLTRRHAQASLRGWDMATSQRLVAGPKSLEHRRVVHEAVFPVQMNGGFALRVGQQKRIAECASGFHLRRAGEHGLEGEGVRLLDGSTRGDARLGELKRRAPRSHQCAGDHNAQTLGFDKKNGASGNRVGRVRYRNRDRFRHAFLFHSGKLDLHPRLATHTVS